MTVVFARCLGVMATLDRLQEENSLLEQKESGKELWMILGHENNILHLFVKVQGQPDGNWWFNLSTEKKKREINK